MATKSCGYEQVGLIRSYSVYDSGPLTLPRLFNIFVIKLLGFKFLRDPGSRDTNGAPLKRRTFSVEDDLDICSYYLQTLSNILRYSTDVTLASLAKEKVVAADEHERSSLHSRRFTYHMFCDSSTNRLRWI